MMNLEGINNIEIDEKNIEKDSIFVKESFDDYSDCVKTESDKDEEEQYDYSDCVKTESDIDEEEQSDYSDCIKTQFDIEEEKRKLEELRTMFEDCGLIEPSKSNKIK